MWSLPTTAVVRIAPVEGEVQGVSPVVRLGDDGALRIVQADADDGSSVSEIFSVCACELTSAFNICTKIVYLLIYV